MKVNSCVLMCAVALTTASAAWGAGVERLRGVEPQTVVGFEQEAGMVVQDGSFEAGSPNPFWTEFSSNFGTPLCSEATCGLGGGTGPNTGAWWAWFGGIAAPEEGSVSQMVTVPAGSATLVFSLELPACSGDPGDFLEVNLGPQTVFEIFGNDASCGVIGYQTIMVDVSNAGGQTLLLEFRSVINGSDTTNFFVDDIDIIGGGGGGLNFTVTGSCPGMTTLSGTGGTPSGRVGIIFSDAEGSDPLTAGPCAGTNSGLVNPQLFTILPLDANGEFSIDRNAPSGVCGTFLQLVDAEAACTLSNVTAVP